MLMMTSLWAIFALAILPTSFAQVDPKYCRISPDHTMCRFAGVGPACGRPIARGINDDDKKLLVDLHNQLRAKVANGQEIQGPQPPAADMFELEWDDELATIAQRWADQCSFGHDRNRKVERFHVGQNVYQSSSSQISPPNFKNAISSFYEEVKLFDRSGVDKFHFSAGVGHYTQIVWAKTRLIGCGAISYKGNGWNNNYIVCNYGQAGNFIGSKIYSRGRPCSACPPGTSCSQKNPGLCATRSPLSVFSPRHRSRLEQPSIPGQPYWPPHPVPPHFNISGAPPLWFPQQPPEQPFILF